MSMAEQVLTLYAAKNGVIDTIPSEEMADFEKLMQRTFKEEFADVVDEIERTGEISDELDGRIKAGMDAVLEHYRLVEGA